jgi:hypothetical protein
MQSAGAAPSNPFLSDDCESSLMQSAGAARPTASPQGVDSVAAALVRLFFDAAGGEALAAACLSALTRRHLAPLLARDPAVQVAPPPPAPPSS